MAYGPTATGDVFDVGLATTDALMRIEQGTPAEQAGGGDEYSNGNGSLMRILPAGLRFKSKPLQSFADHLEKVSAITHGHARSKMACVFHGLMVRQLLLGWRLQSALDSARAEFTSCYQQSSEFSTFRHILEDDLGSVPEAEIVSTGYVLHTLYASLWCLLTTRTFEECVLKAVNLGGDTDTMGCVAGGLAGVNYGLGAIPEKWLRAMARYDEVDALFSRFAQLAASGS